MQLKKISIEIAEKENTIAEGKNDITRVHVDCLDDGVQNFQVQRVEMFSRRGAND